MKFESNEKHLWLVRMKPCESASFLFSLSASLSSSARAAFSRVCLCVSGLRARAEVFWRFSGNISRETSNFPHAIQTKRERERDADTDRQAVASVKREREKTS